jgi:BirA family transcriptional regulator, biotin operon repressor / biotin---[acetyl-CoA-carboxylase] ligase
MFDPVRFRTLLGRSASPDGGAEPPPIGETAIWLPSAGTTQEEARALAQRGAPHGTIVLAEGQSAGRGRRGRSWISPPGAGIWATVILRDPLGPEGPHWLTLAASVAVCEAARELGASGAEIKWPNDLIAGGRKFGGVIGELMPGNRGPTGAGGESAGGPSAARGAGPAPSAAGSVALLGLGVNLELDPRSLPAPMPAATTSLRAEGLSPLAGREELLAAIAARLDLWARALASGRAVRLRERWRELSPSCEGRRVLVEEADGAGAVSGVTRGISEDGSLAVEEETGGAVHLIRFGGTLRFLEGPHGRDDVPRD